MSDTQVRLSQLHKKYGDVHVVRGLDLEIGKGEVVCLLGPSGCGKTTTLRMIAGLEVATSGVIEIGGTVVSSPETFVPPEERRLGMVFQSYAVWPHMDVLANVVYPLKLIGDPEAERKSREALAQVQLGGLEARYPHQLSGGQQQRVALARALVAEPEVLLLDEPLSNLDARLREEMRDEIRSLVKRVGVTVVFVTHDQEEALSMSDRVAVMDQGIIQQYAAPEDLYGKPRSRFVADFVGTLNEIPGERLGGDRVQVGGLELSGFATEDAPATGAVSFGFRPEAVDFADTGIPGVVAGKAFLGPVVRYRVKGDGWEILVDGTPGRAKGDAVAIRPRTGLVLPRQE